MISSAGQANRARTEADFGALLRCGASVAAICAFAAAAPAMAQTAPTVAQTGPTAAQTGPASGAGTAGGTTTTNSQDNATTPAPAPSDEGAIVVTGIRQSLANAQTIKRNSDTVVDAITAQDIGALPDRSVTEALQRVPGVAMNRFAGSNDPDHFSVEGSGVVVRGLNFVRSEFNGRDTFSVGVGGQAINFSDVPAELLGSVEVYKNTTAEMIEGGLAGTVNLNTRKPFDGKPGFHVAFDVEGNYSDFAKKWSPVGSILISDTFDTGIGRFGILADFSYSQVYSRADGIRISNFQTRDAQIAPASNSNAPICRNPLPSNTDVQHLPPGGSCSFTGAAGADGFADLLPLAYAPIGGQFTSENFNRERTGVALAAQWESLDRRALLTAQFLRTDSTNRWGEHTFETGSDLSDYNTYPAGCQQNGNNPQDGPRAQCPVGSLQNYTYDANNVFEKGIITYPGTGWRTADSGSSTTRVSTGGQQQSFNDRQVDEKSIVSDYGLNFKFNPNEHWQINLDGDYTRARHTELDMSVSGSTFADQNVDLTGKIPVVTPLKPLTLSATWAAPNPTMKSETNAQYFADPQFTFWRNAMDHIEDSSGTEWAFQGDVAYKFDPDSFLKRIKFGARYADREETVRYTTYNWGVLSEVWDGAGPAVFMDQTGHASLYTDPNFFRGATPGPPAANYYNGDLIQGYNTASAFFEGINKQWQALGGSQGWVPLAQRAGVVAGTPFLPSEIEPVGMRTDDGYVELSFGRDEPLFGGIRLEGNVGLRYVRDKIQSSGFIGAPTQQAIGVNQTFAQRCPPPVAPAGSPPGTPPPAVTGVCLLGAAGYAQLQQFANGAVAPDTAVNQYHYFLPSLNLKLGLSRDMLIRFAASRVLTRPDMADLRDFLQLGFNGVAVTAQTGNPFLRPAVADQFDLTFEWYFARVGSLTVDAFYKRIKNFFFSSIINKTITNNGVTEQLQLRGPANAPNTGNIKGVEVAYQQTFDFLPGFLSGFGVSANYTYLQSKGIKNSFLNGGVADNTAPTGVAGNLPLEQLSKHNVNLVGFYEKGPISLRVAYNWRSKFLLTAADVIIPYFPIYNAASGSLDASIFINLNKNLKIGVQGSNLTNTVTKTLQQFTTSGMLAPRSYFMNDRRFSFILRGNF
jgi:TonB-dependent receptor